jgi:transglutaminase-like putative cysteine protease
MKSKTLRWIFRFSIFSLFFLSIPFNYISYNHYNINLNTSSASNYTITESLLIQFEGTYTLTHQGSSPRDYFFKFSKIDERSPRSVYTLNTPPYQEINVTNHLITGYDTIQYNKIDKFNNSYDLFNTSLNLNEQVTITQNYTIKLNAINFHTINESKIGNYNYTDELFELYCNKSETFFERDNSELIVASNNIVGSSISPIEKAEKICDWIRDNIDYDGSLNEEKGALWAYQNKKGDCSEFADLMITLLRIQSIPARKITGIVLSSSFNFQPYVGQRFSFSANNEDQNFLGHAWIEYFIPNIGWIACDPTWYQSNGEYFNSIDFYRIAFNEGAWFDYHPLPTKLSEFPYIPSPVTSVDSNYIFNYDVTITILDSNFEQFDIFLVLILTITIIAVISLTIIIITVIIKRRRKEIDYY